MKLKRFHNPGSQISDSRVREPINRIYDQSQFMFKNPQLDQRHIKVIIDCKRVIDMANGQLTEPLEQIIRSWMVDMIDNVLSDSFGRFNHGELRQGEIQCYMAKNLMANVYKLIQEITPKMKKGEQNLVFEFIEKQFTKIISCQICKYPQTHVRGNITRIQKAIAQKDISAHPEFDLLTVSQNDIKFQYKENGNYASQLMKALNNIVSATSQSLYPKSEEYTIFDGLNLMFDTIFGYSGSKQFEIEFNSGLKQFMQFPKQKKLQFFLETFRFSEEREKGKIQYHKTTMMNQYQFDITKKFSQKIKLFTKEEIQLGIFKTSDPYMLNLMIQWAEELRQLLKFANKNIYQRTKAFKTTKGIMASLNEKQKKCLYEIAEEQENNMKIFEENLKKNYRALGSDLHLRNYQVLYANQTDGNLAILASQYQTSLSKYVFEYLNKIIHSLLKVPILAKKLYPVSSEWDNQKANQLESVNLIGYRQNSIVKSQIIGNQRNCIRIFKQIVKIDEICPQLITISKIKDRLDSKHNDILVNIWFMNKYPCELSITLQKHNFTEKQQKLNYFNQIISGLKKSQLGPLAKIACILSQYDPLTQLYTASPELLSAFPTTKSNYRTQTHGSVIDTILDHNNFTEELSLKIESPDFIQQFFKMKYPNNPQNIQIIEKHFKPLNTKQLKDFSQVKAFKNGFILNKNSINTIPSYFETVLIQESIHFVIYDKLNNLKSKVVLRLHPNEKWQQKINQFFILVLKNAKGQITIMRRQNDVQFVVLKSSNSILDLCPKFELEKNTAFQQNQRIVNQAIENNIDRVYLGERNITKELHQINKKNKLKQLIVHGNKIEDLNFLINFPKLQHINLRGNNITKLPAIKYSESLKQIDLSNNNLTQIKELKNIHYITSLKLDNNKISQIPSSLNLGHIKYLSMNSNQLKEFNGLRPIQTLVYLSLNENQITKIDNLDRNQHLEQLYLYNNQITQIGDLKRNKILKVLYLKRNKITKIQHVGDCPLLQNLNLDQNSITVIQGLQKLNSLKELHLSNNQIAIIQNIDNLTSLQQLHISMNKIQKMDNLSNLKQIRLLDLSNNQIAKVQNITGLQNLKQLRVENCRITEIQSFESNISLKTLNLTSNSLQPSQTQKIKKLKQSGINVLI